MTKRQRQEVLDLATAAVPPRKIRQVIRGNHATIRLNRRDIENEVRKVREQKLEGRLPVNALIDVLSESGVYHRVKTDDQVGTSSSPISIGYHILPV